jgi:hypothetical protein
MSDKNPLIKIGVKSKELTDANSFEPNFFVKIMVTFFSAIRRGVFESPPFSLANFFPGISLFSNKYFKTIAITLIYLALIGSLLSIFKPNNNYGMFYIYVICFWIAILIASFWIVMPYDENGVEYMLKNKVIKPIIKIANDAQKEEIENADDKLTTQKESENDLTPTQKESEIDLTPTQKESENDLTPTQKESEEKLVPSIKSVKDDLETTNAKMKEAFEKKP